MKRLIPLAAAIAFAACTADKATPPAAPAPAAALARPAVSRIVFIDKEHPCECTGKAIDASWSALQSALEGAVLPVERIHLDTQEAFAAAYTAKRPLMAVPGIYLLAEGGALVDLLQGEVAPEAIRKALGR